MSSASATFLNDFVSMYSHALEEHVEKGENLDTLSNLARDTLGALLSRSTLPKAPRAPRAPRAAKQAATEAASSEASASTSAEQPAAETRTRKAHTKRAERPNSLKKMNGYNLFVQHTMNNDPVISQKQTKSESGEVTGGMSSKDKMKSCGVAWKNLSDSEHEQWKQRSVGYNFYVHTTMEEPAAEGSTASFTERLTAVQSAWHSMAADVQQGWVARGAEAARVAAEAAAAAASAASTTEAAPTQTA